MNPSDKYQIIGVILMVGAFTCEDPHKRGALWILVICTSILSMFLNVTDHLWKK